MNITKRPHLPIVIAVTLGMALPVNAATSFNSTVISATGEIVDISPLLSEKKQVITPNSSLNKLGDAGQNVHTNFKFMIPQGGLDNLNTQMNAALFSGVTTTPYQGYGFNTPASIACAYKLVSRVVTGCTPDVVTLNPTGGSKVIAIVAAYHYPNALVDLTVFSNQFGLPVPTNYTLEVVYASGTQPANDPYGWEVEEALDLQWAHAMAPDAKLILVEAASNSFIDMNLAVDKASALVAEAGGGEVSMSYGSGEWPTETASDNENHYKTAKVVYFAASGDDGDPSYPCVSPNVVCVGGTTLRRKPTTKAYFQEIAWQDGGSGVSSYFPRPIYQKSLGSQVGLSRGVPDVSIVADPDSGVWVHYSPSDNSTPRWLVLGGTSLSSALFAGIVNSAGHFYASSDIQHTKMYSAGLGSASASYYRNISAGYCGPYVGWSATSAKWDLCTGLGTPLGKSGK